MPSKRNFLLRALLFLTLIVNIAPATTRASNHKVDWDEVQQEALELFIQYLKIDTTNPPGAEIRAAQFFADICKREGIEHQVFEPFPGRGTIWARLRGDGSKRPVILLNHTDVVPHDKEFWTVDAFSGAIKDGFISIAPLLPAQQAAKYANIREAIKNPEFSRQLENDSFARSIIRNTISITMLQGSNKINVIPPAASAEIDTRLVPGEKLDRWIAELRGVIKDDTIKIEPILSFEANASPTDSELVKSVAGASKRRYPEAIISYPVLAGFTDSHYFRDQGVMSYGFSPFIAPPRELGGGYHGNDERIGKKAYVEGVRFFYEVIERLAR